MVARVPAASADLKESASKLEIREQGHVSYMDSNIQEGLGLGYMQIQVSRGVACKLQCRHIVIQYEQDPHIDIVSAVYWHITHDVFPLEQTTNPLQDERLRRGEELRQAHIDDNGFRRINGTQPEANTHATCWQPIFLAKHTLSPAFALAIQGQTFRDA